MADAGGSADVGELGDAGELADAGKTDAGEDAQVPPPGDAGAADASPSPDAQNLPSCTLSSKIELPEAGGTPTFISDGTGAIALWARVGMAIQGLALDLPGATAWGTQLSEWPFYAPVPFATWRDGGRIAVLANDGTNSYIDVGRVDATGAALEQVTRIAAAAPSVRGPVVIAGGDHDLIWWATNDTGTWTGHSALADAAGVQVSAGAFPVANLYSAAWDGTGWVISDTPPMSNQVLLERGSADATSVVATRSSQPNPTQICCPLYTMVSLSRGPSGLLAAIATTQDGLFTAAVDAQLEIGTPVLIDRKGPFEQITLARGSAGFGLAWVNDFTISFVELDDAGVPTTTPVVLSIPALTRQSAYALPITLVQSGAGWWVGWLENVSAPAPTYSVSGIAGRLDCPAH